MSCYGLGQPACWARLRNTFACAKDQAGTGPMALKKVLMVEDSFLIAPGLAQTVAAMGFDVVGQVNTADGALRKIEEAAPDCVLLDVQLRDGDTAKVAEALIERNVPFVVVTGYRRDTLPSVLRKAPYVAKPFQEAELIDAVNTACA